MDMTRELANAEVADNQLANAVRELEECELFLVGGGMGDISLGR